MNNKTFFTKTLLEWNATQNHRELPWKNIENPYFIWLSEIIMQQTRAEQGLPYYLTFTEHYPTVKDLANAPEDEVMRHWQGLGYYSRARNLHAAAKYIAEELGGEFPDTYEEILKLKGVGPYTAAAISSFAFKLPYAVVDGNVYRVLSRFFGIETPIDSTTGKKEFATLAQELLHTKHPDQYNQAIMDFGAKQCSPAKPLCMFCPLNVHCKAFLTGKTANLPIKEKKIKKKERFFYYLVLWYKGSFFIKKRTTKGIWQNLYDFPLIETSKEEPLENLRLLIDTTIKEQIGTIDADGPKKSKSAANVVPEIQFKKISKNYIHLLTHQKINVRFVELTSEQNNLSFGTLGDCNIVTPKKTDELAFPKVILKFFADNELIY